MLNLELFITDGEDVDDFLLIGELEERENVIVLRVYKDISV